MGRSPELRSEGQGHADARNGPVEATERGADETYWAQERLAQGCERAIERLWDTLNAATNKLQVAGQFPLGKLRVPAWAPPRYAAHGIEVRTPTGPGPELSTGEWRRLVERLVRDGWQLVQVEFRHLRFEVEDTGAPRRSWFWFSAHLQNPARLDRATLDGELGVDWTGVPSARRLAGVTRVDAAALRLITRRGRPFLEPILFERITPPRGSPFIDPLILYDLDGDGGSEIILGACNLVYRRSAEGSYDPSLLSEHCPPLVLAAMIGDFDQDGAADWLCAVPEGLRLFRGAQGGVFTEPGRTAWASDAPLVNPMAMTCGDVDGDGDVDVFLGQYKVPTLGQIVRPSYYDANDSHPSFLLLNDGQGRFRDATVEAGLGPHRWRRAFGASLVDLDGDGDLDLLEVSDFAGLDLYRNDGHGRFAASTEHWVADPRSFGMAHTCADFNVDGRLDFLVVGMNSPTVDRLEHLRLVRPGAADDAAMRRRMTYGNRLFLGQPDGRYRQTSLNQALARTGWSWSATAADFDNDGFPDVYITNGHETQASVHEYEPEFWLHDLFVDESADDIAATEYFLDKFARRRDQHWSYGGYEKNRLFLNENGESFLEVGHLAGVALEADSRNVAADDLDGDGRLDLILTTREVWPTAQQTLRIYRNGLTNTAHWIAFRFPETTGGNTTIGTQLRLAAGDRQTVGHLVAGQGLRTQQAHTMHFGLGPATNVDWVEVRWPNGKTTVLEHPPVDRIHLIQPDQQKRR